MVQHSNNYCYYDEYLFCSYLHIFSRIYSICLTLGAYTFTFFFIIIEKRQTKGMNKKKGMKDDNKWKKSEKERDQRDMQLSPLFF